jgi:SAM-dependent methyltransferase
MLRTMPYELLYRIGRTPWDTGVTPPEVVELVEGESALPPGRALDLGCGTGDEVAYLARRGWTATGVELVQIAVDLAGNKIEGLPNAAVRRGDVTKVGEMGLDGPFDLVLDLGCFHSLPSEGRDAYAAGVGSLTVTGGVLFICVRRAVAVEPGGHRRDAGRDERAIRAVVRSRGTDTRQAAAGSGLVPLSSPLTSAKRRRLTPSRAPDVGSIAGVSKIGVIGVLGKKAQTLDTVVRLHAHEGARQISPLPSGSCRGHGEKLERLRGASPIPLPGTWVSPLDEPPGRSSCWWDRQVHDQRVPP